MQLLGAMLEESDEVPQRLLDIILGCLLAPKKDDKPAAYKCAAQRRSAHHIQPGWPASVACVIPVHQEAI